MYGQNSWWQVAVAITVYVLGLIFYRLTLHPLARFPGPKWTAITRYYEAYFDVVKNGAYTFKIAEMHRQYGPIVRISPYELHINDPAYFDILYRQDGHYNKYSWTVDAFAANGATLLTASHDVHKARRQPLGPFFSKARVLSHQDLIHRHQGKLCNRLSKFADTGATFNLGAAATALARDVANDYILGTSYNSLDLEDFDVAMLVASRGFGPIWHITKFVRWFAAAMQAVPISLIMKTASEEVKAFFGQLQRNQDDTRRLMAAAVLPRTDDNSPRTIVHEIMDSKLPPSEKTFERVFRDVSTVSGAGYETTASVLRLLLFHIFSDAQILRRLRAELSAAGMASNHSIDLKVLEQLPYLTAILMEGLRLSPAIATRMTRVAPGTDLFYDEWRIPAGTAVGMTLVLMHADETLYPNPKQFNPERWIDNGVLRKAGPGYAPFSKGTRNCLGMNLAWAELYIVIADLVRRFDFCFATACAEDFECVSDQFAIETRGKGDLITTVTHH